MPPSFRTIPLVLLVSTLLATPIHSQTETPQSRLLTAAQWIEDLDFLEEKLPQTHRHAFDKVTPQAFQQSVAGLRDQIPNLGDAEIIVGMARVVALLRDGHSRLSLPLGSDQAVMPGHVPTAAARDNLYFGVLPIKFYWLSDGVAVQAVSGDRKDLLGARLLRIGSLDAEAALEAVRPVVNYDSEMWYRNWAPVMLTVPEILHVQKITNTPGPVTMTLQFADGRTESATLPVIDPAKKIDWVTLSQAAPAPKPLYQRLPEAPFWFEYIPESRLFYCQINAITDTPEETLAQFSARMVKAAESAPLARFVLDLRLNGGGNNYLNRALVLAISRSEKINRYGTFFTVIGRSTFSAAQNLVNDLEKWTNVIFAGEPTGNSPSMYGDTKRLTLPNSGLTVRLSAVYWRDSSVEEDRPWTAPDLAAPLSLADFRENRDPVLARILAYQAPTSLLEQLKEKYSWGGVDLAGNHYYKYRNSPETANVNTEDVLLALAEFFLDRSEVTAAANAFERATREYPGSFEAFLGLGRLAVQSGRRQKALDALKKALALRPADPLAQEWLTKAEALQ